MAADAASPIGTAPRKIVTGLVSTAMIVTESPFTPRVVSPIVMSASTRAAWQTVAKQDARGLLDAANADVGKVLARNPGNPDALMQRGVATGYIAKLTKSPGLAKDARRDFEAVLAARPNDPLALAAMGGWHGEAVATLGKFLAGTALGAKESEALRYYEKAAASTAADPAVPVFYATTLLNLSARNAPRAQALLARAARAPAGDGFDRLMQQNARAILVPLEGGDVEAARGLAKKLSPLGTVQ